MTTGTCTRCRKHTQIRPIGQRFEQTGKANVMAPALVSTSTGVCQPCETRR